jgi:hypothetical protein
MSLFIKRSYALSAWLSMAVLLSSCAEESKTFTPQAHDDDDWGDEALHPELGGAFSSLTPARATRVFTAKSGAVALTLDGTAQTVVVGKRAVDGRAR